jgi:hypothetical protein
MGRGTPSTQSEEHMSEDMNDQLVLIGGESGTGKSASLQHIRSQPNWYYLNCEAGKRLPFRNDFRSFRIDDPYQIYEAFDHGTGDKDCHGIIIDTATFMMDMLESQYVIPSTNTQQAWGNYAQFFKVLMQQKVVIFGKPVIILAHTRAELDEQAMTMRTAVPVKGSLKNNGIEAYFSTVVATKKMPLKELQEQEYDKELLHISEEDEMLGYKHVFQTRLTKKTVGERIRSPMGLFTREQTFMDNDAQLLLDHLHNFYK